jgi:hypothetical protein
MFFNDSTALDHCLLLHFVASHVGDIQQTQLHHRYHRKLNWIKIEAASGAVERGRGEAKNTIAHRNRENFHFVDFVAIVLSFALQNLCTHRNEKCFFSCFSCIFSSCKNDLNSYAKCTHENYINNNDMLRNVK